MALSLSCIGYIQFKIVVKNNWNFLLNGAKPSNLAHSWGCYSHTTK